MPRGANHSATHLLHQALRNRLGAHVTQKGSMVSADRLRFDFAQPTALTVDDLAAIEAEVNAEIRANAAGEHAPDDARGRDCGGRHGAVRREIWRRSARAQHGHRKGHALFGGTVRVAPMCVRWAISVCSGS